MKSQALVSGIIMSLLITCGCNRHFDTSSDKSSVYLNPGFFNFYKDSNVFVYKTNIIFTRDTEEIYPKSFKVKLPKKIKYCEFISSSDFGFYYSKGQVVFIQIDLDDKMPLIDTIYTPSEEQLDDFILDKLLTGNDKNNNIKTIPLNKRNITQIIKKGSTTILLYNIHKKNYESFYTYVNEFKFINK